MGFKIAFRETNFSCISFDIAAWKLVFLIINCGVLQKFFEKYPNIVVSKVFVLLKYLLSGFSEQFETSFALHR